MNKFQVGDHVTSNSGLTYIVIKVLELDMCDSFAYRVRRLRGGSTYGPERTIAESALWLEYSPPRGLQHI